MDKITEAEEMQNIKQVIAKTLPIDEYCQIDEYLRDFHKKIINYQSGDVYLWEASTNWNKIKKILPCILELRELAKEIIQHKTYHSFLETIKLAQIFGLNSLQIIEIFSE